MAQDDSQEKEAGGRNPSRPEGRAEASQEKTAEEKPGFKDEKQRTDEEEQRIERPTIPDTQKPQIPQEENIPTGGPGDQGQAQPSTTQPQTQEEKAEEIKKELKRPIQINTPQERKESSEIEDGHNKDVLSQP